MKVYELEGEAMDMDGFLKLLAESLRPARAAFLPPASEEENTLARKVQYYSHDPFDRCLAAVVQLGSKVVDGLLRRMVIPDPDWNDFEQPIRVTVCPWPKCSLVTMKVWMLNDFSSFECADSDYYVSEGYCSRHASDMSSRLSHISVKDWQSLGDDEREDLLGQHWEMMTGRAVAALHEGGLSAAEYDYWVDYL